MENELNKLKSLRSEHIVGIAPGFEDCSNLVVMEDVGVSLKQIICSGDAGKLLACVVYRDIWCVALKDLKKAKICHADIHEGNICLLVKDTLDNTGRLKATLVDLESAMTYNNNLRRAPIKIRRDGELFFDQAQEAWDKASVCSILECLWDETLSLEDIRGRAECWVDQLKETGEEPQIIATIKGSKAQYLPD